MLCQKQTKNVMNYLKIVILICNKWISALLLFFRWLCCFTWIFFSDIFLLFCLCVVMHCFHQLPWFFCIVYTSSVLTLQSLLPAYRASCSAVRFFLLLVTLCSVCSFGLAAPPAFPFTEHFKSSVFRVCTLSSHNLPIIAKICRTDTIWVFFS